MKHMILGVGASLLLGGCVIIDAEPVTSVDVGGFEAARADIIAVLDKQSAAWNHGDIDAFMEGYWKSEQLRFASGGDVTRGWEATIDRYKSRYTDKAAMGTLAFTDLDVQLVASDAAIVHGRWALVRAKGRPSGLFTLIFRNFGNAWVIVSDTTTSAD